MSIATQKTRAAAVQAASVLYDREKTLDKAVALIEEAARNGAELAAFPESFLPGYPYHIWIGAPVWYQPHFKEWFLNAVEVPGKTTDVLCEAARVNGIDVIMGINERDGKSCYNTLLFIDRQGRLLGKHRKVMVTHAERTQWANGGGGSNLEAFDFERYRLSGLICWEHSMDLTRHAMIAQRPEIHVGAWVGGKAFPPWWDHFDDLPDLCCRYHAHVGDCFVINVHGTLDKAGYDKLIEIEYQAEKLRLGGGLSSIIGPGGKVLAGPVADEETILYADLDFGDIADWAHLHDAVGHYARPDLFSLMVNNEEYRVTRPMHAQTADLSS